MGKCRFKADWLKKTDPNGYSYSQWVKKLNDSAIYCLVCDSPVTILKGVQSLTQHSCTKKHKENSLIKLGPLQMRLSSAGLQQPGPSSDVAIASPSVAQCNGSTSSGKSSQELSKDSTIALYTVQDAATIAELIWTMKTVACNYSLASAKGIVDTFRAMFPNAVPSQLSLSPAKMAYIISDALGPYFRQQLLDDLQQSMYTLKYDETTNNKGKKELQIAVQYWSEKTNQVEVHHLETFFLGHATGEDLKDHLCLAIKNSDLPMTNLIMLGSDGPNVNKKVYRLMNEEVKSLRPKGLLDVGTCNLHIVHNAFQKGLAEFGEDTSDLVLAIYHFFENWPSRIEEYQQIQEKVGLPHNKFIKHVSSRWLTLEYSLDRVIEQWDAIEKYFLKHIPMKQPNLQTTSKYKTIFRLLSTVNMKAQLKFVLSSVQIFSKFTRSFQAEEPLIHKLHSELQSLLKSLLVRIIRKEGLKKFSDYDSDILQKEYLLPFKEIDCGNEAEKILSAMKESDVLKFKKNVQGHYISAAKHLMVKTAIGSTLVKNLSYLQPSERKHKASTSAIIQIAESLPFRDGSLSLDTLSGEWKLLQLERGSSELHSSRIDHYWRQFFPNYPTVAKVVKVCLSMSHGSADVERGFSLSGRVLSEDKAAMSLRTLNAKLTVADALKRVNNKPELIPITKKLITLCRCAYISYHTYLADIKKQEQEKARNDQIRKDNLEKEELCKRKLQQEKKSIDELESTVKKQKIEEKTKRAASEALLSEANERLKKALKSKDMKEIQVAQAMIEGVTTVHREVEESEKKCDVLQKKLDKKKSSLITTFFSKK